MKSESKVKAPSVFPPRRFASHRQNQQFADDYKTMNKLYQNEISRRIILHKATPFFYTIFI